jgi:hypothetical protein
MCKKFFIGLGVCLISIYVLFLLLPFFIGGFVNSYNDDISKIIEESSGFKVKLGEIKLLTTPKLTVGGGVTHLEVALPTGETFLTADNVGGKLSLLSLLARRVEIDVVGAENVNVNLKVKKDGKFLLEDYIQSDDASSKNDNQTTSISELPFGLKLSNHLPNIKINNYNISFIDIPTDKTYSLYGDKVTVTDFILNKKVKINADGKFMLQDKVQFNFDVKLLNKIMPDVDLNDLVFNPTEETQEKKQSQTINIIEIFKAIYNNNLTADINANVVTSGTVEDIDFDGTLNVTNLGVNVDGKKLPESTADVTLKGNKIKLYTKLYTAEKELTEIVGNLQVGKNTKIDLNCKSNAQLKSVVDLLDSVAKTFGYKDLDTLSATGAIDADFTLKSNLKKTESSGYLKISSASVTYKLYNFVISKLSANVDFANNTPNFNVNMAGVNYKDIASNTVLNVSGVNLVKNIVDITNAKVINPALVVSIPTAKIALSDKEININSANLVYDCFKFTIKGIISDYLTQTIKMDITADYNGQARVKGSIKDYKTLDLAMTTPKTFSMQIPGLKNSNVKFSADVNVSGDVADPTLKGSISVPTLSIPDMQTSLSELKVNLSGKILQGSGTLKKFTSGGIVAENLTSNFNLKDNIFYLKSVAGEAFLGKVSGNISYNILNGHIGVDFNGSGMNAGNAIAGAVGIKNALSGTLGFSANVTLHGATDTEMMKNLKGKASFEVADGELGNIGRFENFVLAQNISSNSILKSAVSSITSLSTVKNTAKFKTISGNLTFANGWANLASIKMSGPTMAYYVTGKYNLLNSTANVVVLGRLSAEVVKLLGVLGDLSVSKLTSYIPKFGTATGNVINAFTANPNAEKVSSIPALSSGETNYKDFKVQFNGGVESKSSVKSFKWLSNCDTSALDALTVKEQVQSAKTVVTEAYQEKKQAYQENLQEQKEQAQQSKEQVQSAIEGLKNLKNNLLNK